MRSSPALSGWGLVLASTALIAAGALAFAAVDAFDQDGLRMAIRFTARTSLILFLMAFCASPLARLWPGSGTGWLIDNRRYLGLSFAASHLLHAVAIAAFAITAPLAFHEATSPSTYVFGGIGYAFIAAMAANSFDRTAAAVGPRAFKLLHRIGAFYLWAQFTVSFTRHADGMLPYRIFLAMLCIAMLLRIAAALRPRRHPAQLPR